MKTFVQLLICIFAFALTLYVCIERQNELTELQLAIPVLEKELHQLEDQNTHLAYEIHQFESPEHLLHLMSKPEFNHLKFPDDNQVIFLQEGKNHD